MSGLSPERALVLRRLIEDLLGGSATLLPAVREAFGVALPTAWDLATIGGLAIVVMFAIEIAKAVLRKSGERAQPRPGPA